MHHQELSDPGLSKLQSRQDLKSKFDVAELELAAGLQQILQHIVIDLGDTPSRSRVQQQGTAIGMCQQGRRTSTRAANKQIPGREVLRTK